MNLFPHLLRFPSRRLKAVACSTTAMGQLAGGACLHGWGPTQSRLVFFYPVKDNQRLVLSDPPRQYRREHLTHSPLSLFDPARDDWILVLSDAAPSAQCHWVLSDYDQRSPHDDSSLPWLIVRSPCEQTPARAQWIWTPLTPIRSFPEKESQTIFLLARDLNQVWAAPSLSLP